MPLPQYSRVELVTDRFSSQGASKGMLGYIIEVYPDDEYEVEFPDGATGKALAQIVASEDDLELTVDSRA